MSKFRFQVREDGSIEPSDGTQPDDTEQDDSANEPIDLGMPGLNAADEAISDHLGDCGETGEGNLLEAQRNIDNARSNLRQHAMTSHHANVAGDDDGPADDALAESFRQRPTVTLSLRERAAPRRARAIKIECLGPR